VIYRVPLGTISSGDLSTSGNRVRVAVADSVSHSASVLSIVGGVGGGPDLAVHRAVKTLRNTSSGQDVTIHESAGLEGTVLVGMCLVVTRLCSASTGTCLESEALILREGEKFAAHEGVFVVGVQWSIDGATQADGSGESSD